MSTVTDRISQVKQPRGGYIKPSSMTVKELNDGIVLNEQENISPSIIGTVVDYLTRFSMGANINDAFKISIKGARAAEALTKNNKSKELEGYLKNITSFDNVSIVNACKAATFDVWYRNPNVASTSKNASETNPDDETIENIKTLINRSVSFWKEYGPVKVDGFDFGIKGYTNVVTKGDGDFLTEDTLWDFKVLKSEPKSNHTLQLLMYYIMGKHSEKPEFNGINKIGIFNPRLNKVYLLDMNAIPNDIIKTVEEEVICYE